jgi:DTW domain-containing protein YfiP
MGCESMVFGDTDAELKLLEDIKSEIESDNPSTCILYPCSNSILMSDWIQTRTKSMKISEHSSPTRKNDGTIRLVVLDGTYANASRLWKYLTKSMRLLYNLELPVVKLDLEHGRCRSAIVGIMSQPGEEKICSFQAAVMAMRQADCDVNICNKLNNVLDEWLLYMLKTKVKFGKSKFRLIPGVDRTPSDHIREFLVCHLCC